MSFSQQQRRILTQNFAHVLVIQSHVKIPKGIS